MRIRFALASTYEVDLWDEERGELWSLFDYPERIAEINFVEFEFDTDRTYQQLEDDGVIGLLGDGVALAYSQRFGDGHIDAAYLHVESREIAPTGQKGLHFED